MAFRGSAAGLALLLAGCVGSGHTGPVSDHFDGRQFFNEAPFEVGWRDLWRYYRERDPGEWTRDLTPPDHPDPARRVATGELLVTVVNHATVLVQFDGTNVLTDPIWSDRASPVSWAGPKRFVAPGLRFEQLPPIDAVVISHDHYDHLDLPTLKKLQAAHQPQFIVGLGEDVWLRRAGLRDVIALDWQSSVTLRNSARIHGQRSKHWTSRVPGRRNRSLWMAYVIETQGGPVYFSGDSGYDRHFSETAAAFGPMRLALLPIGAYQPRWLTAYQHLDPSEAVRAHQDLRAARSLAIHFGTFQLAEEGQTQPVVDLTAALAAAGLTHADFAAPEFGVGYGVPALSFPPPLDALP